MSGDEQQRHSHIGIKFHETYPFDRSRISGIVRSVYQLQQLQPNRTLINRDQLEQANPSLGSRAAREFYPNWGIATGLLHRKSSQFGLTAFGLAAQQFDPTLQQLDSCWMMHYNLASPNGPGPYYWHRLFADILQPGSEVDRQSLMSAVSNVMVEFKGIAPTPNTVKKAVTAFLVSYFPSGGLDKLRLLEEANTPLQVSVAYEPITISPAGFGVALVHYWERAVPSRLTLNLEALLEDGGLARLLFLDRGLLYQYLHALEDIGMVEVFRSAHPHQIVRRWDEHSLESMRDQLFHKMYSHDSA